jgi:hypothetical protein
VGTSQNNACTIINELTYLVFTNDQLYDEVEKPHIGKRGARWLTREDYRLEASLSEAIHIGIAWHPEKCSGMGLNTMRLAALVVKICMKPVKDRKGKIRTLKWR